MKNKDTLFKLLQRLPLAIMAAITILVVFLGKNITSEGLLRYTPSNDFLAAVCLIGMYALKSLSVVFPILVLYFCGGFLFSPIVAALVNLLGVFVCLSLPYWIGYYSGAELTDRLIDKYPKAKKLDELKNNNEFFLSYITRMIGILPGDIVSLLLGCRRVGYVKYILGSLAGMLPGIICFTLLGDNFTNPLSWQFILSSSVTAVLSIGSFFWYRKMMK